MSLVPVCGSSSEEDVSNLLECTICMDMCQIPIQQCSNGHNICTSHLPQLMDFKCPSCRVPYTGIIRNLLAEKLVIKKRKKLEQQKYKGIGRARSITPARQPTKCRYWVDGCRVEELSNAVQEHERICDFRPIICCLETNGCSNSEIPFREYINHLKTTHKVKSFEGSTHVHKYLVGAHQKVVRNGSSSLFIMETCGRSFLVTAKLYDEIVHIFVGIHGNAYEGLKYEAWIEFMPIYPNEGDAIYVAIRSTRTHFSDQEILSQPEPFFSLSVDHVETNLKAERGKYLKYWSVKVVITPVFQQRSTLQGWPQVYTIDSDSSSDEANVERSITASAVRPITWASIAQLHSAANPSNLRETPTRIAPTGGQSLASNLWRNMVSDLPSGSAQENPTNLFPPTSRAMSDFTRDFYRAGDGRPTRQEWISDLELRRSASAAPRTSSPPPIQRSTTLNSPWTSSDSNDTNDIYLQRQTVRPSVNDKGICCIQ